MNSQGLYQSKTTNAMASNAPLTGLKAPFKITVWPWTFLVPFLDLPVCAVFKEGALQKSGLANQNYEIQGLNSLHSRYRTGSCTACQTCAVSASPGGHSWTESCRPPLRHRDRKNRSTRWSEEEKRQIQALLMLVIRSYCNHHYTTLKP